MMKTKKFSNMLKFLRKSFSKDRVFSDAGMTITELLLAGVGGTIVMGAAGVFLFNTVGQQNNVGDQVELRTNVSRALDFMKSESKQAIELHKAEELTPPEGEVEISPTFSDNVTVSGSGYVALAMSLPNLAESVVYYLDAPPSGSIVEGPLVLYRWGPKLDANGNYVDGQYPGNWTSEPLIGMIDDQAPSPAPSCSGSGWTLSPDASTAAATGFYACISSDQKASRIFINGVTDQAFTEEDVTAQTETTLFASLSPSSDVAPAAAPIVSAAIASTPNCEVTNGILGCDQPADLAMEIIGDAFNCGGTVPILTQFKVNGDFLTTTREVTSQQWQRINGRWRRVTVTNTVTEPKNFRANDSNYESTLNLPVNPDTEIVVKSLPATGTCARTRITDSSSDRPFIEALKNGDTIPTVSGYSGQDSVASFLLNYTDPADRSKVKIEDNQIIFLFEMYTNTSGSTYDLQDNVVLVTVNPQTQAQN